MSSRENAGTSSISAPARSMVAGTDEEVLHARRLDAIVERRVVHDHVVDRALDVAVADPEPGGRVALRVEVDHQDPVADLRERGAEVDGGGRLADAALLVGDRDDPGQASSSRRAPRRRPGGSPRLGSRLGAVGVASGRRRRRRPRASRRPRRPSVGSRRGSPASPFRREPLQSTPAPPPLRSRVDLRAASAGLLPGHAEPAPPRTAVRLLRCHPASLRHAGNRTVRLCDAMHRASGTAERPAACLSEPAYTGDVRRGTCGDGRRSVLRAILADLERDRSTSVRNVRLSAMFHVEHRSDYQSGRLAGLPAGRGIVGRRRRGLVEAAEVGALRDHGAGRGRTRDPPSDVLGPAVRAPARGLAHDQEPADPHEAAADLGRDRRAGRSSGPSRGRRSPGSSAIVGPVLGPALEDLDPIRRDPELARSSPRGPRTAGPRTRPARRRPSGQQRGEDEARARRRRSRDRRTGPGRTAELRERPRRRSRARGRGGRPDRPGRETVATARSDEDLEQLRLGPPRALTPG